MVLNPNPEPTKLMKKMCVMDGCGRKIIVVRIDWEKRYDFVCATCKTKRREEVRARFLYKF